MSQSETCSNSSQSDSVSSSPSLASSQRSHQESSPQIGERTSGRQDGQWLAVVSSHSSSQRKPSHWTSSTKLHSQQSSGPFSSPPSSPHLWFGINFANQVQSREIQKEKKTTMMTQTSTRQSPLASQQRRVLQPHPQLPLTLEQVMCPTTLIVETITIIIITTIISTLEGLITTPAPPLRAQNLLQMPRCRP